MRTSRSARRQPPHYPQQPPGQVFINASMVYMPPPGTVFIPSPDFAAEHFLFYGGHPGNMPFLTGQPYPSSTYYLPPHEDLSKTFFDKSPILDAEQQPRLLNIPKDIKNVMKALEKEGYFVVLRGGYPRRKILSQHLKSQGKTLPPESTLHQDKKTCDIDLVTNAPKHVVVRLAGRAENSNKQNILVRINKFRNTGRQLDIEYNSQIRTLSALSDVVDFYSRSICVDSDGHYYDASGHSVDAASQLSMRGPKPLAQIFHDNPIHIINYIETLVKYKSEMPSFDMQASIEQDNIADHFSLLKRIEPGHIAAKIFALLRGNHSKISLQVLDKTGLLQFLFPFKLLDKTHDDAWLEEKICLTISDFKKIPAQLHHLYLFDVFIALMLDDVIEYGQIDFIIASHPQLLSIYHKCEARPNYERIIALAKERIASHCHYHKQQFDGLMVIAFEYEKKANADLVESHHTHQGLSHYQAANALLDAAQFASDSFTKINSVSRAKMHLLLASCLTPLTRLADNDIPEVDRQRLEHYTKELIDEMTAAAQGLEKELTEFNKVKEKMMREYFAEHHQIVEDINLYRNDILARMRFIKKQYGEPLYKTDDEIKIFYKDYAISCFLAAWIQFCTGKLNLSSRLLNQAAEFSAKIPSASELTGLLYQIRAYLNDIINDPIEAMYSFEQLALHLEQHDAGNREKQLHVFKQALELTEKANLFLNNNPHYFDNKIATAGNCSAKQKALEMKQAIPQQIKNNLARFAETIKQLEAQIKSGIILAPQPAISIASDEISDDLSAIPYEQFAMIARHENPASSQSRLFTNPKGKGKGKRQPARHNNAPSQAKPSPRSRNKCKE